MFDSTYFSESLPKQVDEMGGVIVSCEMTLANGHKYRIQSIVKIETRWVWLAVYPDSGVTDQTRSERSQNIDQEVRWDRLAVPYDMIKEVLLTLAGKHGGRELGFHTQKL